MKKYIQQLTKYVLGMILVLTTTNCADDDLFRETNTNPETFVSVDPSTQLTGIQAAMSGGWFEQWRANLIYGEGFIQHLGGSWPVANYGSFFIASREYQEALWISNYGGGLVRNLVDVLEKTNGKPEFNNLNGMAKVLKVMTFQRLTDLYGDIPYSEAGLGYYKKIFYPKYDSQKDIYTDFFKVLDEAQNQMQPQSIPTKGDLFYAGDAAKWKKMISALRLRCAMRISKVDPALAKEQILKAVANGLFTSNADNCYMKHDATLPETAGALNNGNGVSQGLKGSGPVYDHPTITILNLLGNDPRKKIWFRLNPNGIYEGINPNNYRWDHLPSSNNLSELQPYLYENSAPYLHFTYSEVMLLLAEASFKGLYTGDAKDYYKKGIEAGIRQWSIFKDESIIDNAAINTFLATKNLTPGKELEEIATQQWLTFFLNGIEAYTNYRRTDFPVLIKITRPASGTNGIMPTRMPYPIEESTSNRDNYLAASAKYNNNSWLAKVWWDVD
ncbi:SusD/RagB family nutrient-binding outer membrane lipoprotein [Flavobacterium sp. Fl-318]|uniref:SusD/RagB family nutrient-binding outer membrane lipoprotein n=1 Tax=Flavobacterium cupriresistens TaxID=2893885 RepID=A0ABU4RI97_9FLAO|nr:MULTISPECIES: SusD/RagB family nutrient-binding outer membrane lipoprotein [unclassified Flavobacterium]MDX6191469.1 SusD/RagB family nutrient-binding outer membrane lipoprotein [Flavobacterium sp. Fl-318]UFH43233.1 SusD/RagB family nutrient-binding outer membrane lipoprotein [Flavobacterium sp. F-323]